MAKMTLQQEIDQVFEHLCCYDRWEWDELVAAIQAQALRDAAAIQDEESARIREAYRQHNASRDPNRPPRRPDLNVWSNADEATAHRLRARADTIEKEAGRG